MNYHWNIVEQDNKIWRGKATKHNRKEWEYEGKKVQKNLFIGIKTNDAINSHV